MAIVLDLVGRVYSREEVNAMLDQFEGQRARVRFNWINPMGKGKGEKTFADADGTFKRNRYGYMVFCYFGDKKHTASLPYHASRKRPIFTCITIDELPSR
jgi:hypothetical protein